MTRFGLLTTFLIAIAMIAWHELKVEQRVPHPDLFVKAAVVWGVLGVLSELGVPDIAAVFGIGAVISMAYVYYNQTPELPRRGGGGRF